MTKKPIIKLEVLKEEYAVCRMPASSPIPSWISSDGFVSITRTDEELSIVCLDKAIPDDTCFKNGWRIIKVLGPLDFSLVGILSSISTILADAQVSIFAVSTYDTDYILVQNEKLDNAIDALSKSDYSFIHSEQR
ncbi:ACT domain-containing protein [Clostridia bacterium]|nr:ACT domain-containing protein [Clostridia bacterium]